MPLMPDTEVEKPYVTPQLPPRRLHLETNRVDQGRGSCRHEGPHEGLGVAGQEQESPTSTPQTERQTEVRQ